MKDTDVERSSVIVLKSFTNYSVSNLDLFLMSIDMIFW